MENLYVLKIKGFFLNRNSIQKRVTPTLTTKLSEALILEEDSLNDFADNLQYFTEQGFDIYKIDFTKQSTVITNLNKDK